jgi:hypothetical protein
MSAPIETLNNAIAAPQETIDIEAMEIQTVEVPVTLNDNPESKVLYRFDIPTNAMEPKALLRYALIQYRGWKAFAKSLAEMHNLYEGPNGTIVGLPTIHDIRDWVNEYFETFDEDMVRVATKELVFEAVVRHFNEIDFEEEEIKTPTLKYVTTCLNAKKYEATVKMTNVETEKKPKATKTKKSPKAKKTEEKTEAENVEPEKTEAENVEPEKTEEEEKPKAKKAKKSPKTSYFFEHTQEVTNVEAEKTEEEEKPKAKKAKKSPKAKKTEEKTEAENVEAEKPEEEEEKPKATKTKKSPKAKKTEEKTEAGDVETEKTEEEPSKKKRSPTAYNLFISAEISRLRAENPSLNHKVAMSMAVSAWKSAKQGATETTTPEVTAEEVTAALEWAMEPEVSLEHVLSA